MIINAPAKINLFLHIVGKQNDGYHLIESLFLILPKLHDVLEIEKSDSIDLVVKGEHSTQSGNVQDNIVIKAAKLLQEKSAEKNYGAKIILQKNIPVGAGLGGGSSDAACVLLALNEFWNIGLSKDELADLGLKLGADVPFFIHNQNAFVSGIGEKICPVNIQDMHILLVNPKVHVSTVEVYKKFDGKFSDKIADIEKIDANYIANAHNALQSAAVEISDKISEVLDFLKEQDGCKFARMSGSGATCFGVFENEASLNNAFNKASNLYWAFKTN